MESLYDDILTLILLKSRFKENCTTRLVSKNFNRLITSEEYLKKIYEIKYGKIHSDEITFSYLVDLKKKKII